MERCLVDTSGCVLCWLLLQKAPGALCCAEGTWGQSAPFTFHVTCAQTLCLEQVLILWHQGPPSMLAFIIKIFPSLLRWDCSDPSLQALQLSLAH